MRKTIVIGDKYKPLMDYYSSCFNREEFNIFITKLLVAYKNMKDKNIDLIIFSDLVEPYEIDIIQLIKLIDNMETKNENNKDKTKEQNINKEKTKEKETEFKKDKEKKETPILNLGIDLSK